MCPACMTTVALIASGSASAGGLAVLLANMVRAGGSAQRIAPQDEAKKTAQHQGANS